MALTFKKLLMFLALFLVGILGALTWYTQHVTSVLKRANSEQGDLAEEYRLISEMRLQNSTMTLPIIDVIRTQHMNNTLHLFQHMPAKISERQKSLYGLRL